MPTCVSWLATSPPRASAPSNLRRRRARTRSTARTALDDRHETRRPRTQRHSGPRPRHHRDAGLPRARTSGPTTRRSTSSSTSVCSRTGRPTDPRLHRRAARAAARLARTTPARAAARAASSSGSREGTWLGHVAEHVALQLQQEVGHDLRRGKTRQVPGERGRYNVIYGYVDENVGIAAGRLAVRLVNHLVQAEPDFDFEAELERFIVRAERTAFGPSTQAILDEAVSRDIPWIRLNQYSLVQLGQGVHQKRIRATMTSNTSAIAVDVASDKDLTGRLLSAAGLPVPQAESVRTADQAVAVADADRLPRRGQAARRQPRPRRLPRPAERGRRPRGLPDRAGPVAPRLGDRRVVRHRQGLPLPGDRRQDRRDRRASAGPRRRRRRAHGRRAGRRAPTPTRGAVSATRRC